MGKALKLMKTQLKGPNLCTLSYFPKLSSSLNWSLCLWGLMFETPALQDASNLQNKQVKECAPIFSVVDYI